MPPTSITIQSPATSANCGSGFDTLAIALSLYNFVKISILKNTSIIPSSLPSKAFSTANSNSKKILYTHSNPNITTQTTQMLETALHAFERHTQKKLPALEVNIWGDIPPTRGLGSSAAIRGGFIAGLNELFGKPLSQEALIRLTASLEQSVDNTTALFKGGFCVVRTNPKTGQYVHSLRFDISNKIGFAVISPSFEVSTSKARTILPQNISLQDAVKTVNSCAYLVSALITQNYDLLNADLPDFIHEPYRKTLTPFVDEAIAAGRASGAYAGWLSGSGSSIVCICPFEKTLSVSQAMGNIFTRNGIQNQIFQLQADLQGLRVITEKKDTI